MSNVFVDHLVQGTGEETKDYEFWIVNCPDHQCYQNVALDHESRARMTDTQFTHWLEMQTKMVRMELGDMGCDHAIPPISEWER